jgi:hypothetical protein
MIPEGEFADSAETIDPKDRFLSVNILPLIFPAISLPLFEWLLNEFP